MKVGYMKLRCHFAPLPQVADPAKCITQETSYIQICWYAFHSPIHVYYDILSAFCKSLRGSDSSAALYWAERLIDAGCDPLIILRRLIVHSSEDIGMANSNALVVATSALTAYEKIGMPEAKIPMFHAIIYVCESPKSNSVIIARDRVEDAVKNIKSEQVPNHLREASYAVEKVEGYKYPHNYGGYCEQQYLPDELVGTTFYDPLPYGDEIKVIERQKKLNKIK